jgi:hypothetical protein
MRRPYISVGWFVINACMGILYCINCILGMFVTLNLQEYSARVYLGTSSYLGGHVVGCVRVCTCMGIDGSDGSVWCEANRKAHTDDALTH